MREIGGVFFFSLNLNPENRGTTRKTQEKERVEWERLGGEGNKERGRERL